MPFSQSGQLSTIVRFAEKLNPKTVLDVGTGMGQYGFILRNNLESVNLFEIQGNKGWQRDKSQWLVKIDGIEGFSGYITPVHSYAYNEMFIGSAVDILSKIPSNTYDLVLAIDIIEHFEKSDGELFARECARVSRQSALISTPKEFHPQTVDANPLENHRSLWSKDELAALGYKENLPNDESWVVIHSK